MIASSLHLAPSAPWPWIALLSIGIAALGLWAYRFAVPPLPARARRILPALRLLALGILAWLLAQPVFERTTGSGLHVVVLVDRSRSMDLPLGPGSGTRSGAGRGHAARSAGPGRRGSDAGSLSRARAADQVVADLARAWRGRATVEAIPFAARLGAGQPVAPRTGVPPGGAAGREGTALGDALLALAGSAEGQRANAVVVVSDGAVNAGEDPVAAARALGVPVHAVVVGEVGGSDRAVTGVESAGIAQVGHATTLRARLTSTEERGTPITVRLLDGTVERSRSIALAPGPGQEATVELSVTPLRPGLAVWTACADSIPAEISVVNNARQVAVEVAPGRLAVAIVSAGLNWDLAFLRRALAGDSSLSLSTWVREREDWKRLERPAPAPGTGGPAPEASSPDAASLRGQAVVAVDGVSPAAAGGGFDAALAALVRGGGGLLLLGGSPPGLERYRGGALGTELALRPGGEPAALGARPEPAPEALELLSWDDDPGRGEAAWRDAAPLSDVLPIAPGPGDRVLIGTRGGGPPLFLIRRIGRGQALLVNGSGLWRWSLSGHDDLSEERGHRLWRRIIHWLAEPVQGEPLRIRPERWLTPAGEPVRLFATLQDSQFRPVAGARIEGEVQDASGGVQRILFEPGAGTPGGPSGSYEAVIENAAAGRYRVRARAVTAQPGGGELGRGGTEFAVDPWSLEEARTLPDSASLAAMARASGGRIASAPSAARWARGLPTRLLARRRGDSVRLWESPWVFALVVGMLSLEWAWRRRRGLP